MAHSLPVPPLGLFPFWVCVWEFSSKHILCLEFLFCKWQGCPSQRGL